MIPRHQFLAILILTSLILLMVLSAGCTGFDPPPQGDIYVFKVDSAGTEEWHTMIDRGGADKGYAIIQTSDGGYAIGGEYVAPEDYIFNPRLIKFNKSGVVEWDQYYPIEAAKIVQILQTSNDEYVAAVRYDRTLLISGTGALKATIASSGGILRDVRDLIQTRDRGFVQAGDSPGWSSQYGWDRYGWIQKSDWKGNLLWNRTYQLNFTYYSVLETSNGGYIAGTEHHILRLDTDGNVIWVKETGSGAERIRETAPGQYHILCYGGKCEMGMDANGTIQFTKNLNGTSPIRWTEDGGYVFVSVRSPKGYSFFFDDAHPIHIVKLDQTGEVAWDRVYQLGRGGVINDFVVADDGGYVVLTTLD